MPKMAFLDRNPKYSKIIFLCISGLGRDQRIQKIPLHRNSRQKKFFSKIWIFRQVPTCKNLLILTILATPTLKLQHGRTIWGRKLSFAQKMPWLVSYSMLQTAIPYLSNFARSERFQKRCQKWHFWTEIRSTPKSFFCAFQDSAGTRESKKYHFIEIPDKKIFSQKFEFFDRSRPAKTCWFWPFWQPQLWSFSTAEPYEVGSCPLHRRCLG